MPSQSQWTPDPFLVDLIASLPMWVLWAPENEATSTKTHLSMGNVLNLEPWRSLKLGKQTSHNRREQKKEDSESWNRNRRPKYEMMTGTRQSIYSEVYRRTQKETHPISMPTCIQGVINVLLFFNDNSLSGVFFKGLTTEAMGRGQTVNGREKSSLQDSCSGTLWTRTS